MLFSLKDYTNQQKCPWNSKEWDLQEPFAALSLLENSHITCWTSTTKNTDHKCVNNTNYGSLLHLLSFILSLKLLVWSRSFWNHMDIFWCIASRGGCQILLCGFWGTPQIRNPLFPEIFFRKGGGGYTPNRNLLFEPKSGVFEQKS